MNDEPEWTWKKLAVTESRQYSGICLEEIENTKKNFSQDRLCPDGDSNRGPPICKSSVIATSTYQNAISKPRIHIGMSNMYTRRSTLVKSHQGIPHKLEMLC
jgi:hypothetical protein